MINLTSKIISDIDEVLREINKQKNTIRHAEQNDWQTYTKVAMSLHTKISAIFYKYAPNNSPFYQNSQPILGEFQQRIMGGVTIGDSLSQLEGILEALKDAYIHDYFRTIAQDITSDVFSDFLEMAEYFLTQGDQYKHPAAFLIGGVLEEHLRKLADKNGIPVMKDQTHFRKAEDLNADLKKNGVYVENEKKQISALLALRNDADHAHWLKYTKEQVDLMLHQVRRIISQYPA